MAWTAPGTWTVGQVSTAADWNTYVAANTEFLATPPMWKAYRTSSLTLTAGGVNTFPLDTVLFDSAAGYSTSTFLYTVAVAGTYLVTVVLNSGVATAGHYGLVGIYKAGTAYSYGANGIAEGAGAWGATVTDLVGPCTVGSTINAVYDAVDADVVDVSPAASRNWFSGLKVSN